MHSRQPGVHVAPIFLIFAVIFVDECGLLVPADERRGDDPEGSRPQYKGQTAEQQRLTEHDHDQSQIHGIADITIEPCDHQTLGWRYRHRRAARLDELHEGMHGRYEPYDDQYHANRLQQPPRQTGTRYLPTSYQPWDEADDGTRCHHEERRRGDPGC